MSEQFWACSDNLSGHFKNLISLKLVKCPDKMSEQAQNCLDIMEFRLTLTEIIVFAIILSGYFARAK